MSKMGVVVSGVLFVLAFSTYEHAQRGPIRLPIAPNQFLLTAGGATTALSAELMFFSNNGVGKNVTTSIHWSSSNPTIASIGASTGIVTPNAKGTVLITASSGPFHGTAWITVLPSGATINSVTVSANPAIPSTGLPKGLSNQFLATAQLSNGSTQDITDISTWASSAPSIASIHANGPLVGIATATASSGATTITATPPAPYSSKIGTASLKVGPAVPIQVAITPSSQDLPFGNPLHLAAYQVFSDNTTQNVTAAAAWSSSNKSIANVNNSGTSANGTITTTGIGQITITAFVGGLSGLATINVIHSFDAFGGLNNISCTTTGWFHTQKVGNQWWLCTPPGHVFFMTGVYVVAPDRHVDDTGNTYDARAKIKYGDDGPLWAEATDKRLHSWGFNTLGPYYNTYALPTYLDSNNYPIDPNGFFSHPTKLTFAPIVKPGYYSMLNAPGPTGIPYLSEAVKDIVFGHSQFYAGSVSGSSAFLPGAGIADYYDSKVDTWLNSELMNTSSRSPWNALRTSPYLNYMLGVFCEDSDQTYGFGATPDFSTTPLSRNSNNLGWIIATMSPVQVANSSKGQIYLDTEVKTKTAWMSQLSSKYGTISALNTAWGSNYTTFGSTGVKQTETIGVGNGSTASFTHTIGATKLHPSRFSVQIRLCNQVVGGDVGDGKLYGSSIGSGTIDYSSGTITVTFKAPPANKIAVTASFIQNGWGLGSGLLDEDGRASHQSWLSKDFYLLTGANSNVKADLNALIEQTAEHFFKSCHDGIKAAFPNNMYFGPANLSNWSVPSRDVVLQAGSKYMDLMLGAGETPYTQPMIDYVAANFGDKPYMEGEYRTANSDSPLSPFSDSVVGGFGSQSNRGQSYYNAVSSLQALATTGGSHPYVGAMWWQFVDNFGEDLNWGLVTTSDNAYDGIEDQVTFSTDPLGYSRGGEKKNYGDALTLVKQANQTWIQTH